jgi:hypothetical protein
MNKGNAKGPEKGPFITIRKYSYKAYSAEIEL